MKDDFQSERHIVRNRVAELSDIFSKLYDAALHLVFIQFEDSSTKPLKNTAGVCMATNNTNDAFKSRVSINILLNLVRTALTAVIGLLMVPYYLRELGLSTYAIITLSTSVTTYVLALTDPLGSSFARYMFKAIKNNNREEIDRTYSTSVIGMSRVLLILTPICLLISYLAPQLFNTGSVADLEIRLLFAMVLLSSLIIAFSTCLSCVFDAYNKMYITYAVKIVYILMQVALILIFFNDFGASLMYIGAAYVIAAIVMILILWVCVKRTCPFLHISRKYYDRGTLRKIMGLGTWIILSNIGTLLYIDTSLIICNMTMGAAEQGTFSIASNAISIIGTAANTVSSVVSPLIYEAYSNRDNEELMTTLHFFIKFIGCLIAFPIAFLMVFAPQVIETWLGTGYEAVYPMLYIMLPGHVAVCSVKAMSMVSAAYERVRPSAIGMIFFGLVNVVLALTLPELTGWGTLAICFAWTLSMILSHAGFTVLYTAHLTGTSPKGLYTVIVKSYALFIILLAVGYGFTCCYTIHSTWLSLIFTFAVPLVIYVPLVIKYAFNNAEKHMMKSFMPQFMQNALHL